MRLHQTAPPESRESRIRFSELMNPHDAGNVTGSEPFLESTASVRPFGLRCSRRFKRGRPV
jgi:hypothetical protein